MAIQKLMKRSTGSRLPGFRLFPVLLVALSLLGGCLHVQFIGDYDETIDKGITEVQLKAATYFNRLKSAPDTPYDPAFYDDIDAHLDTLKTRATVLPKNTIIVEEIGNLRSEFDKFQAEDSGRKRPVPAIVPTAAESAIATTVESILKLELALKRGDKSAPELK